MGGGRLPVGESGGRDIGSRSAIGVSRDERFSTQNLWYMRKFYKEYPADEKLQPLVGEIASGSRRPASRIRKLSRRSTRPMN